MGKNKASKESRFYLYVKFLPAFASVREDFTYNSNDEKGPQKAIYWLMNRVLNGTVKGKYQYAKLHDRQLGRTLSVWTPEHGQMPFETFNQLILSKSLYSGRQLKASVAFLPRAQAHRDAYGLPALLTLIGVTKDGEGEDIALQSIYDQVMNGKYKDDFRHAYVYDQNDKEVARIDASGLSYRCEAFRKEIMKNSQLSHLNTIS